MHLAHRLGYLSEEKYAELDGQGDVVSRTLAGLIQAVEKEANPVARVAAKLTSFMFFSIGSAVCCL